MDTTTARFGFGGLTGLGIGLLGLPLVQTIACFLIWAGLCGVIFMAGDN